MVELQLIDKWLLEEAVDSISHTGKLTIDYICSHVSEKKSLTANNEEFTRLGIKETLYHVAKKLNLRFRALKYPVRVSTIKGRLEFRFHEYNSVIDNTDEYIAFLQRTITTRREELEKLNAIRTKDISDTVIITETNSLTEAEKLKIQQKKDEERRDWNQR